MAENELVSVLKTLHLTETSAIQMVKTSEDYVLDLAAQSSCDGCMLAATSSNHSIRLFSRQNLASTTTITGHNDVITSIRFCKTEPSLLLSASLDGTVRCWDLRTDTSNAAQTFQGSSKTNNLFTAIDVNASDRVICAGMERDKESDVYLLFWERRGGKLLGCYSESHEDDITQVCFHPDHSDRLASGSLDGLVCVYDIWESNEDDALSLVLNSCSTVARLGWTGRDNKNIYCITHVDSFHMWETDEGDPVLEKTDLKDKLNEYITIRVSNSLDPDQASRSVRADLSPNCLHFLMSPEKLEESVTIDYLVDHFCTNSEGSYMLGGKHNGDLTVIQLTQDNELEVVGSLSNGHKSTVRCLHWDNKTNTLVTGGEDSLLCLWSAEEQQTSSPSKMKLKTEKSAPRRKVPY